MRGAAYRDLLGGVVIYQGRVYRRPPAPDPFFPWCRVTSIKMGKIEEDQLLGQSTDDALTVSRDYTGPLILTVTYKTPTTDQTQADDQNSSEQQEIEIATESFEFSAQSLTLPNDHFVWESTYGSSQKFLVQEGLQATKLFPTVQYVLQRHLCVRLPTGAILNNLGRVNSAAFTVRKTTWPAECLRFDGASCSHKISSFGEKFWDITYKFSGQPTYDYIETGYESYVGWNRLYRPSENRYERPVLSSNSSRRIYQLDSGTPLQIIAGRQVGGFKQLFHPRGY